VARNSDGVFRCDLPTIDAPPPSSQTTRLIPLLSAGRPLNINFHSYIRPRYLSLASLVPQPNSSAAGDTPQRSTTPLQRPDGVSSTSRWSLPGKDIPWDWRRGTCGRRMSQRFVHLALLLHTPPLGPSNYEDTDPPLALVVHVPSRAREPKFSAFPDERVHLLPPTWSIGHHTTYGPPHSSSSPSAGP
jgi:hypothetical protein